MSNALMWCGRSVVKCQVVPLIRNVQMRKGAQMKNYALIKKNVLLRKCVMIFKTVMMYFKKSALMCYSAPLSSSALMLNNVSQNNNATAQNSVQLKSSALPLNSALRRPRQSWTSRMRMSAGMNLRRCVKTVYQQVLPLLKLFPPSPFPRSAMLLLLVLAMGFCLDPMSIHVGSVMLMPALTSPT